MAADDSRPRPHDALAVEMATQFSAQLSAVVEVQYRSTEKGPVHSWGFRPTDAVRRLGQTAQWAAAYFGRPRIEPARNAAPASPALALDLGVVR